MNEYTLGEPLTESVMGQMFIRIKKETGEIQSGTFTGGTYPLDPCSLWTYFADPRPMPSPPAVKEEPKLFRSYGADYHLLTDEGRRRLERLLRESEGE